MEIHAKAMRNSRSNSNVLHNQQSNDKHQMTNTIDTLPIFSLGYFITLIQIYFSLTFTHHYILHAKLLLATTVIECCNKYKTLKTNFLSLYQVIRLVSCNNVNQAQSEYKHVLANILRSLFVARVPPVEASSPDCRSNIENAPHHPPVTGQQHAQNPHSRPFALCRHIVGWTQACN